MISAIITAYKEPETISKAIESIAKQKVADEIILVAPDESTLTKAANLKRKYPELRIYQDSGDGKPSALNLAVSLARGKILILTDGDVYVGEKSLKLLIDKMKNPKTGSVSGRPISTSSKNKMLGYWSYLLTEIAHERRLRALRANKRFFSSGYLFSIKKDLFPKLSAEILSEDGFISDKVYRQGFRIDYEPNAKVYVKYPSTLKDWIIQKRRSAGGYNQIRKSEGVEIRSFKKESLGALDFLKKTKNIKELTWVLILFMLRVYIWILIYKDINIKKKSREELWTPVKSTK